jgi:putative cell wall-binding protein
MEIGKVTFLISALSALALLPAVSSAYVSYDVIVVRGDVPTDYIIASIYAGTEKIPLVFVSPDNIQDQVRKGLLGYRGKGYQLLLIIGGESAISANVENELKDMGYIVNRLWDWNRYGTAARVAIDLWGDSQEVVIADGEDYSGFLLAQEMALEKGVPILFIMNRTVPDETRDAIRKLGAKSAILISPDDEASQAVESMGIVVERIETVERNVSENKGGDPLTDFYMVLSASVIAALVVFIVARQMSGRKVSMFVMTEDEERLIEILNAQGKTEQNRLASLTGYSKPRVSRMLRSLEERGIIEREKHKKTFKVKLKRQIR